MSEYKVWFTQSASTAMTVEAEDPDAAIDAAYDHGLPSGLCHRCACEFDMSGDWEPDVVEDSGGNEVWPDVR